jgi:hypothetical membrane protein
MDSTLMLLTGALAPLWMLLGVYFCAKLYPNYSHTQQVMSELGARNRPTTRIHPYINNYPIGILFILFGLAILHSLGHETIIRVTAIMMIGQGVSHLVTGLFPCDENLGRENPSLSQHIHNFAGLLMLLTLIILAVWWGVSATSPVWFAAFSWLCLLIFSVYFYFMVRNLKSENNLGLYQRISYGALAFWVVVLSWYLFLLI